MRPAPATRRRAERLLARTRSNVDTFARRQEKMQIARVVRGRVTLAFHQRRYAIGRMQETATEGSN